VFVANLTRDQQQVLLNLAHHFMFVDGHGDDRELAVIEHIKSQCHGPLTPNAVEMTELAKLFSSNKSKVSLMLELLVLTLADENYHANEKYLLDEVAAKLSIDANQFDKLKIWAQRHLVLSQEADNLMK